MLPYLLNTNKSGLPALKFNLAIFTKEYLIFYCPVYSITLMILAAYLLKWQEQTQHLAFNVTFGVTYTSGVLALVVLTLRRQSFDFEVVSAFFFINIPSLLWVLFLIIKIESVIESSSTPTYSWLEILASIFITIIPIITHFALTLVKAPLRIVFIAPAMFIFIVYLTIGFPAFGGFVLRQASAGGGTPIAFISNQTGPGTQHGCLVLATPTYFFIELTAPGAPCPTLARSVFQASRSSKQPLHQLSILPHDQLQFPVMK